MNFCVAYVTAIVVSVMTAFGLAFLAGGITKAIAFVSLATSLVASFFIFRKKYSPSRFRDWRKINLGAWILLFIFFICCLRAFLWLVYQKSNSLFILSPFNLGDLTVHSAYIRHIASGARFWAESPIFAWGGIHYSAGVDLFNSLLLLSGLDLVQGLIWVGLLGSLVTGVMLFLWGGEFAVAGFLFNGGIWAFLSPKEVLFSTFQQKISWKSLFLALLVPQRNFLFAFPAGLLLLCEWRERFLKKKWDKTVWVPFWAEALVYFSMPFFHIHTFIFLSSLLFFWFLFYAETRRHILKLWIISVVPATVLVLTVTDFMKTAPMVHFHFGWEQGKQDFFKYWLMNFGLFLPLAGLLCFKQILGGKKTGPVLNEKNAFIFPSCILIVLFSNLMLSPWTWDNIKALVWPYLILLPYLWEDLIAYWPKIARIAVCAVLFFTGFLQMAAGLDGRHGYEIFSLSEIRGIESAAAQLPPTARFAAFPKGNHPLLFAGRKVSVGYVAWLWSYGIPVGDKDKKLTRLMMGESDWRELAKELKADHIFWGRDEEREYKNSKKPWAVESAKIASGKWGAIYKI